MSRIEEVLKISLKPQGTTSAKYPERPVFNQKEKTLALRLYVATKIKQKHYASCDVPVISLEELFLPSQSLVPMSLQKAGVCMFDHADDGKCGLRLRHEYADMTYSQFVNILKNLNITKAQEKT